VLFPGKTMLFPGKTIGTYRLDGAVRAPPSPGMEPELLGIVTKLIDGLAGRNRIDVVDDLAYPFPVAVICELLGVPHEDEPRFHAWVEKGMESLDPKLDPTEQQRTKAQVVAKLRLVADFLACCWSTNGYPQRMPAHVPGLAAGPPGQRGDAGLRELDLLKSIPGFGGDGGSGVATPAPHRRAPEQTVPEQAIVRRTMSGSPHDCRRGYFAFLAASSWPGSSGAVAFRTSSANFR